MHNILFRADMNFNSKSIDGESRGASFPSSCEKDYEDNHENQCYGDETEGCREQNKRKKENRYRRQAWY